MREWEQGQDCRREWATDRENKGDRESEREREREREQGYGVPANTTCFSQTCCRPASSSLGQRQQAVLAWTQRHPAGQERQTEKCETDRSSRARETDRERVRQTDPVGRETQTDTEREREKRQEQGMLTLSFPLSLCSSFLLPPLPLFMLLIPQYFINLWRWRDLMWLPSFKQYY